jgi:hypothetical protein
MLLPRVSLAAEPKLLPASEDKDKFTGVAL